MDYSALPKIELHCHLDGSVRPKTIIELGQKQNIPVSTNEAEVAQLLMVQEDCQNLDEYLSCFALPIEVMQTEEAIERISFELFEDAAKENVKYLEVRFAPLLHTLKGLSVEQIIASAVKGMKRAESMYGIHGNYILSVVRHMPKDNIKSVIDAGQPLLNKGVVAFDIAGGERPGFCEEYVEYCQYAQEMGYRITIHAGEQGCGQNVYDAISLLNADRIGHGVDIQDHAGAYDLTQKNRLAVELCPTSNVNTRCINEFSDHPIARFHEEGVLVTINTDNRTVSNTTMTNEIRKVFEQFKLTMDDYQTIYKNSVNYSFASNEVKEQLLAAANG